MILSNGLELTLTLAERALRDGEGETILELMLWVQAGPPAGDVAQVTVWERAGNARRERNFIAKPEAFERFFARLTEAGWGEPQLDPPDGTGDLWTGARLVLTPPDCPTITFTVESTVGTYDGPDADALRLAFSELLRVCHVGHHQAWWFLTGQPPG